MNDISPAQWMAYWLAASRARLDVALRQATGIDDREARELAEAAESEIAAFRLAAQDVPATWLTSRLGLTATEERVVWLLIASEVVEYARNALLSLSADRHPDPTVAVIQRVVYGPQSSLCGWRELGPESRLSRLGLIQRTDDGRLDAPEHRQTVRVAPRLRALALGDRALADELTTLAAINSEALPVEELVVSDGVVAQLAAQIEKPRSFVIVTGPVGSGRATVLRAVARAASQRLLEVDASRLSEDPEIFKRQLNAVTRESCLLGCSIFVRNIDSLVEPTTGREQRLRLLTSELLDAANGPLLASALSRPNGLRSARRAVTVELGPLRTTQRAILWRRALPACIESDIECLARRYSFAPSVISAVGEAIRARCDDLPTESDLMSAISSTIDDRLAGLATRVEVTQSWDDLVLPPDQARSVTELLARIRERTQVYEDWGFATKLGKGLGVSALLSGPPGTGKTMAASLIAKDLGLSLYRVDLAQMVSKFIGETEKNLSTLFDAAESTQAVLLFDEADSLFGKRTEVKSSNDRYANLEVNYLLQRLESFTGICLLTTNHENAIDPAFQRRLAFHIRFPVPDDEEREQLWRALIPSAVPMDPGVDFGDLARQVELSGGQIRNAVLRAAFLAADEGAAIAMSHLWSAAITECEAAGKIAPQRSTLF